MLDLTPALLNSRECWNVRPAPGPCVTLAPALQGLTPFFRSSVDLQDGI